MAYTVSFNAPSIPGVFGMQGKVLQILQAVIDDFGFEEQQAIYFYYHMDLPLGDIAAAVGLSKRHVAAVLGLYAERLSGKLELLKKAMTFEEGDDLPISDILIPYQLYREAD